MLEVNLTPHGAGVRLRKPAFAALTIAATATSPAAAQAPAQPATAMKASMTSHALVGSKLRLKGALFAPAGSPIVVQQAKRHRWRTVASPRRSARSRSAA
jgi:hypothetical protein